MKNDSASIKIIRGRKAREKGYRFESLAALWLTIKGYKIIARNFKIGRGTAYGEIDIIALKGKTVVFFEVKSRKTSDLAADAVTLKNKQRVTKSAEVFLARHPQFSDFGVRFDAVLSGSCGFPHHVKDAWRPQWW